MARRVGMVAFAAALAAGPWADRAPVRTPIVLGGYRVLQVDFHTHSSLSDGALTPFGLVLEARRQGLDAFAITGHNRIVDSYMGEWFSGLVGGPLVLRGQEILRPDRHTIAVGIHEKVNFLQSASATIADIHRQGGIAIAAHPGNDMVWDDAGIRGLDGAEICHPLVYAAAGAQERFEEFRAKAAAVRMPGRPPAAIGSSDHHGMGPMGLCRTFVFATNLSTASILDAVRNGRTVVYGPNNRVYGDPALMALAERDGRLKETIPLPARGPLDRLSGVLGLLGLAGVWFFAPARRAAGA